MRLMHSTMTSFSSALLLLSVSLAQIWTDPIPTWLIAPSLVVLGTSLPAHSHSHYHSLQFLSSGAVHSLFKHAVVTPLLKQPSLEPETPKQAFYPMFLKTLCLCFMFLGLFYSLCTSNHSVLPSTTWACTIRCVLLIHIFWPRASLLQMSAAGEIMWYTLESLGEWKNWGPPPPRLPVQAWIDDRDCLTVPSLFSRPSPRMLVELPPFTTWVGLFRLLVSPFCVTHQTREIRQSLLFLLRPHYLQFSSHVSSNVPSNIASIHLHKKFI